MQTTKDKPILKELPEDYRKFVEWISYNIEWDFHSDKIKWMNVFTSELKTTDELYQFYLIGK